MKKYVSILAVICLCMFWGSCGAAENKHIEIKEVYEVTDSELMDEYISTGQMVTFVRYYELSDGTWKTDDRNYQYRLVISGRMGGAVKDSTFVYLSNRKEISFEQAWKASGLSSYTGDYFNPEEAVLVAIN